MDDTPTQAARVQDLTTLRHRQQHLEGVITSLPNAVCVMDLEGRITLCNAAFAQLTSAEGGCAGLRTPEGIVCRQYLRPPEALPLTHCWPPGHGLHRWLLAHNRPYLTNDAALNPQIVPAVREAFGVRSAPSIPILDRHGEVLGFFALHNKRRPGLRPSIRKSPYPSAIRR
jgi:hypothetical protein